MKSIPLLLAGALLAGMATTTVIADYGGTKAGTADSKKSYAMSEGRMGKHDMTGTIETIDPAKGLVGLKTDLGTLNLHFPPESIKDLKKGDTITVNLSYSKKGDEKKQEMR